MAAFLYAGRFYGYIKNSIDARTPRRIGLRGFMVLYEILCAMHAGTLQNSVRPVCRYLLKSCALGGLSKNLCAGGAGLAEILYAVVAGRRYFPKFCERRPRDLLKSCERRVLNQILCAVAGTH